MYDPPAYVWTVTLIEVIGFVAATCLALYSGARSAGSGRGPAALLGGAAAAVLGGWFTLSGVIAAGGHYHTVLGKQPPWLPIAAGTFLLSLLAMSRIPAVARAVAGPGSLSRLTLPHTFRVGGVAFLMLMALGHLPALFALPAGLGDIAIGIEAPFVARRLARGTGRRGAMWFTALGIADLVNALALGGLLAFKLINISPPADAISLLPIALVPTAGVPLLLALHVVSLRQLLAMRRAPQPLAAQQGITLG